MAAMLPYLLQGVGSIAQAGQTRDALRQGAANTDAEGQQVLAEGYQNESTNRRSARQLLGEQAASLAENGGSAGAEDLVKQSEANAELDALNIRYGANTKAQGLFSQADQMRKQSKNKAGLFLAGGQVLQGIGAQRQAQG